MSWSDTLKGALGNLVGEAEQAAMPGLVEKVIGPERVLAKLDEPDDGLPRASFRKRVTVGPDTQELTRNLFALHF